MSQRAFNRISVVGLGYIGLPTAAMFASCEIEVVGVDVNQDAVDTINRGEIHIVEPELDAAVSKAVDQGFLRATTTPEPADAFLIAVPTPFKGDDHEPDLSYVEAAARAIAPVLQRDNLVILESTSPVGATEAMAAWLASERPDLSFPQESGDESDIRIAHCPERVLPGKVMQELITNDRVVGGMTAACSARAVALYETFVGGECVIASGPRLAEMAKLTENSFRDVNIAFANELSLICHDLDMDVWELIALANRHPRVDILQPGPGVGGHCIAVDPWFIVASAPQTAKLIRSGRVVNDAKPHWVVSRIMEEIDRWSCDSEESRKPVIGVYGLAFKPNIDGFRESPAVNILRALMVNTTCKIVVVEPNLDADSFEGIQVAKLKDSLESSDIHVLLVDHDEFLGEAPNSEFVVDTRGIWNGSK